MDVIKNNIKKIVKLLFFSLPFLQESVGEYLYNNGLTFFYFKKSFNKIEVFNITN